MAALTVDLGGGPFVCPDCTIEMERQERKRLAAIQQAAMMMVIVTTTPKVDGY